MHITARKSGKSLADDVRGTAKTIGGQVSRVTNEKIKEILDRCNGRFGWVQIHIDTEENYMLMPLADLVELLEKQLPKPIYEHIDTRLIYKVRYDKFRCSECGFTTKFTDGHTAQYKYCPQCGRRISWEVTE